MQSLFLLSLSFISLFWSAQYLVTSAVGIANHYKLPPLILGLTIVALGSSAPQIMIAINAGLIGHAEFNMSKALGISIANIGLVLGITALMYPYHFRTRELKQEYPMLFVIMLFMSLLIEDGHISAIDGLLIIIGFLLIFGFIFFMTSHTRIAPLPHKKIAKFKFANTLMTQVVIFIISLAIMTLSSKFFIQESETLLKLSSMIQTNFLAMVTGIPVLITSLVAAFKKENDIAIGNILGANLFNLLTILACPWVLHHETKPTMPLWINAAAMSFIAFILFSINKKQSHRIHRWQGGLLLLIYVAFVLGLSLK